MTLIQYLQLSTPARWSSAQITMFLIDHGLSENHTQSYTLNRAPLVSEYTIYTAEGILMFSPLNSSIPLYQKG